MLFSLSVLIYNQNKTNNKVSHPFLRDLSCCQTIAHNNVSSKPLLLQKAAADSSENDRSMVIIRFNPAGVEVSYLYSYKWLFDHALERAAQLREVSHSPLQVFHGLEIFPNDQIVYQKELANIIDSM
jgi:hypothetical protein